MRRSTEEVGRETWAASTPHQFRCTAGAGRSISRCHRSAPSSSSMSRNSLGARLFAPGRCEFRVWSPHRERVELRIVAPYDRTIPMEKDADGYHVAVTDAREGARYYYVLDGIQRPDPASRFQPEGVHGASEVVDSNFEWHDSQWNGIALEDFVIYELHVGTFTAEGTF